MQPKLRLLNTDKWRRFRVTENGKEAKISKGPIRKPGRRYGELPFSEKHLDGSTFDAEVEISDSFVKITQPSDQRQFRSAFAPEAAKIKSQVGEIFLESVGAQICPLWIPEEQRCLAGGDDGYETGLEVLRLDFPKTSGRNPRLI